MIVSTRINVDGLLPEFADVNDEWDLTLLDRSETKAGVEAAHLIERPAGESFQATGGIAQQPDAALHAKYGHLMSDIIPLAARAALAQRSAQLVTRTTRGVTKMVLNTRVSAMLAIGVTTSMLQAAIAHANPLCASTQQRQAIEAALSASPQSTPAQIARKTGIAEAAVVNGLPAQTRVPVPMSDFEEVWQRLVEWDDALLIALSSESVFEMVGPLPEGSSDRGYFNFDEPQISYGGHLKVDRLAAIYLLSTMGQNGETHQVAFFDDQGRRVFSVYVPRDDEGALKTQPHNRFLRLKHEYAANGERLSLTDLSCLWSTPADQDMVRSKESSE